MADQNTHTHTPGTRAGESVYNDIERGKQPFPFLFTLFRSVNACVVIQTPQVKKRSKLL